MGLVELGSASAVQSFLETSSNNSNVVAAVVTFSAHWCGPCRNSKPALEELAVKQNSAHNGNVKMGIVYEDTLGDAIHSYKIRAFPTHVLYIRGIEEQRVEGANVLAIEAMIQAAILKHNISSTSMPMTGGSTLGGGGSTAATASEAREARLAKLAVSNVTATATRLDPMIEDAAAAAVAADAADVKIEQTIDELDADIEMEDVAKDSDVPTPTSTVEDPTAKINQEFVQMLTEDMGFSLLRAQKGLIFGNGGTVDGAVEWLTEHQDDIDIDEDNIINQFAATAMSYKCNECGCILSNMANLELHANKTGHSDFEESTHRVEPLTEEQKTAKIAEIKVRTNCRFC